MTQILGLITVFLIIIGALAFSGSPAIVDALPFELALIGGAAAGTLLIGNSPQVAKAAAGGFVTAMKGPKWRRSDYGDLLTGMHDLMRRARRGGIVAIEADIEAPASSPVFTNRPKLLADENPVSFVVSGKDLAQIGDEHPDAFERIKDRWKSKTIDVASGECFATGRLPLVSCHSDS